MSGTSGQLVAKLILTGDAKGVVGAGKEAEAALDGVNAKAKQTNATVGATPAQFDAAAVAIKGQTDATAKATAAITASGAARTSEVARLRDQGAAAESTIAKVQALSKAHGEYNATIASARAMVAAKTITEAEYTTLASAASAKLAADLAAVRVEATATGMALDRMEANLAKLGKFGGVPKGVISRTRAGLAAIPELIGAFPVVSAAAGAAAAIGVLIAAEQSYEASIGHLNVTLQAHGLALASTNEHYLSLAGDVAAAAKTSTISAREMEASFANSHLDTSLWADVAAMSRDYAAVLGTDIPTAAAKAAENLEKPYEWAVQLTQQYGLFDQATLKQIRDLEEQGRVTEAQKIITDGWSARIKNAADQTSGWARAWNGVSTAVSNTWDAIGRGIFGSKSEDLKLQLKNAQSDLDWRLNAKSSGYKMAYMDEQIAYYRQRVAEIKAELKSIDPNTEKRNIAANAARELGDTYDPQNAALQKNLNERKRILKWYDDGVIDFDKKTSLLAGNSKAYIDILEQQTGAQAGVTSATRDGSDVMARFAGTVKIAADAMKENIEQDREVVDAANDVSQRYLALQGPFAVAKKAAEDWRDGHIAALGGAANITKEKMAEIEAVFRDDMRLAYDEGLRNSRDWAAGVIAANQDLTRSEEDWASRSHELLTEASREFKDDFVSSIVNQKDVLGSFFSWFGEQLVRLAYQKSGMEGTMNSLLGGVVSIVGDVLGVSGGGYGAETVSMTGTPMNLSAGVNHLGDWVGSSGVTRQVPASLFYSAPRYHGGGDLAPGEVAIIAKDDERIQTHQQAERSDAAERAVSYISDMARPVVMMLPNSATQQSGAPNITVKFIDNVGTKKTASPPKQDSSGGWNVDVLIDQLDNELADRSMRGTSALTRSLESTHGIDRRPS